MVKTSKVSALVLALVLASASGLASAAFKPNMTAAQVKAEVAEQVKNKKSLADIAAEAKEAGVPAADLTTALIEAGQPATSVAAAVAAANPKEAAAVKSAAIAAAPAGERDAIQQALITTPGVNPGDVAGATAAQAPVAPQLSIPNTPAVSGGGVSKS
ncbi:MAG: hypothetical protein PHP57_00165 [Sideroxydans sp.]|nr:hypothetical protein [Sideroxydans sp.]